MPAVVNLHGGVEPVNLHGGVEPVNTCVKFIIIYDLLKLQIIQKYLFAL